MIIQMTLIMTLGHTEVVQMHPLAQELVVTENCNRRNRLFFLRSFLKHLQLITAGGGTALKEHLFFPMKIFLSYDTTHPYFF